MSDFIVGAKGFSLASATVATNAVDTTNANLILVGLAYRGSRVVQSVTDNMGNSFRLLSSTDAFSDTDLYICENPTPGQPPIVGAGHIITATFTVSGSEQNIAMVAFGRMLLLPSVDKDLALANIDSTAPRQSQVLTTGWKHCMLIVFVAGGDINPATLTVDAANSNPPDNWTKPASASDENGSAHWACSFLYRQVGEIGAYQLAYEIAGATDGESSEAHICAARSFMHPAAPMGGRQYQMP